VSGGSGAAACCRHKEASIGSISAACQHDHIQGSSRRRLRTLAAGGVAIVLLAGWAWWATHRHEVGFPTPASSLRPGDCIDLRPGVVIGDGPDAGVHQPGFRLAPCSSSPEWVVIGSRLAQPDSNRLLADGQALCEAGAAQAGVAPVVMDTDTATPAAAAPFERRVHLEFSPQPGTNRDVTGTWAVCLARPSMVNPAFNQNR
jgi:hypothetical protein